jgi:hypothetical protein
VARLAEAGQPEVMDARQERPHLRGAVAQLSVVPPRRDHQGGVGDRGADGVVVAGADRIARAVEARRLGGAEGEQVDHRQAGEAKPAGEAEGAADRRVVVRLVGGRGVQHDEDEVLARVARAAGQQVAVPAHSTRWRSAARAARSWR